MIGRYVPVEIPSLNSHNDQIRQHHLILHFKRLHVLVLTVCHSRKQGISAGLLTQNNEQTPGGHEQDKAIHTTGRTSRR